MEETILNTNVKKRKNILLNFCIEKKDYLITFLIMSFLFVLFLTINGVFCSERTILISDSFSQISEFFNHFFDFIEGKSILFYSNRYGKGIEIFSTMQYMFINPFYIIVLLAGRNYIYQTFAVSIFCMITFTALTALWFEKKYMKNINIYLKILFSLLYTFSPYLNFNYGFITWQIYPALILILIDRFLYFIKTDKIISFSLVFIWYVISCYSIGISTAILLFIIFTSYVLIVIEKSEKNKKLFNLFIVFFITAISSIVILLPSVIAILNTERSNSLVQSLFTLNHEYELPKLSVLLSDFPLYILTVIFFIKCDKKDKFNIFLMSSFAILLLPMLLDSILKIICFSSYSGFFSRFYFLNEVSIFVPCLLLIDKDLISSDKETTKSVSKVIICLIDALSIILVAVIVLFMRDSIGSQIKNPVFTNNSVFIFYLIIDSFILMCFLFNLFFTLKKSLSRKFLKTQLMLLLIIPLSMNYLFFTGNTYYEYSSEREVKEIISKSNISGNVEFINVSNLLNQNNNFDNLRTVSVFSSLVSKKTISSFSNLGYCAAKVSCITSTGTLISDCLMGIQYYISEIKDDRPYLELIDTNDDYYVYKNTLASSGAFVLDSNFSFEAEDFYGYFNQLKNYFEIEGDLFIEPEVQIRDINEDNEEYKEIEINAPSNGILYVNSIVVRDEEKEDEFYLYDSSNTFLNEIKYLNAGEVYKFKIKKKYDSTNITDFECKFMNYDVASQICTKIQENEMEFNYKKDGYTVKIDVEKDSNLFIMNPNINGMNYSLNDSEISISEVLGAMLCVSVNENDTEFVATYRFPQRKIWIISLIICIILILIAFFSYKYLRIKIIENIVSFMMKFVFISLICIIYVIGTLFSIVSFIAIFV